MPKATKQEVTREQLLQLARLTDLYWQYEGAVPGETQRAARAKRKKFEEALWGSRLAIAVAAQAAISDAESRGESRSTTRSVESGGKGGGEREPLEVWAIIDGDGRVLGAFGDRERAEEHAAYCTKQKPLLPACTYCRYVVPIPHPEPAGAGEPEAMELLLRLASKPDWHVYSTDTDNWYACETNGPLHHAETALGLATELGLLPSPPAKGGA